MLVEHTSVTNFNEQGYPALPNPEYTDCTSAKEKDPTNEHPDMTKNKLND